MAHVQKFTRGASTRIIEHCERTRDANGKYKKYRTNSDIDDSKTQHNYSFLLKGHPANGKERLQEILNNTYCMDRSDIIVMADWVITLPQAYKGDERSFFKACSAFIVDRYGADSYIGGWVHLDERAHHIHLAFCPREYDDKKNRWKVCAKSVLNKKELNDFHGDLEAYLMARGLVEKGQILNGITKMTGGNKTIPELKQLSERVEKVKGLVSQLDEYIPEEDVNEISELLEEIKNGLGEDHDTTAELELSPTVVKKKEKVK